MQKPRKVRLILSGGGIPGVLSHLGAIIALKQLGYTFSEVAGVSAGGLLAGAIARDFPIQDVIPEFLINRLKIEPNWSWSALGSRPAFLKTNAYALLRELFPGSIKRVKTPLHIVTSNISTEHQMIWSSRTHDLPMADVLYASMAIPFVFKPMSINGMVHVDGGTTSNFPGDDVFGDHDDILMLAITRNPPTPSNPKNFIQFAEKIVNTKFNHDRLEDITTSKMTVIPVTTYGSTLQTKINREYATSVAQWGYQSVMEYFNEG